MKNVNCDEYNKVSPSGTVQMGDEEVTYYRMNGNRLWFDKLQIERVLTGKNQHNLLGSYKDHRNHGTIFDEEKKCLVEVISKTGVHNYLKKARSVSEENRHYFYFGIKNIENPHEEKVSEPLQMPIFDTDLAKKITNFVKISEENSGEYTIDYTIYGKNSDEKRQNLARFLITAASNLMSGKGVKLKEVA